MILDGKELSPGDSIYSLYRGAGVVQSVNPGNATVRFGSMLLVVSDANIQQNGQKVIGLGKPLVYWPKNMYARDVSAYLPVIEALEQIT